MTGPETPHRGRLLRIVATGLAGAAAFGVGITVSKSNLSEYDSAQIVTPARSGIAATRPVAPPATARRFAADASIESPALTRMSEHVTRNPFAPLSVAPASMPAPLVAIMPKQRAPPALKSVQSTEMALPPAAPAPPTAPPLPFTAFGSISGPEATAGKLVAFVKSQDKLLLLRSGDVIAQTYLVDAITPSRIEFIYRPLMQRQVLLLAP